MWWTIGVALAAKGSKDQRAVDAVFADYVARASVFDASAAELFTDQATITSERDGRRMALTGAEWKQLTAQLMPVAQARNDVDTYSGVVVSPTEAMGRWRVRAVRENAARCTSDPDFRMDFAKIDRQWRIVGMHSASTSRSACPPYPDLEARLQTIQASLVPLLPMKLDEESELRAVQADGTTFTYTTFLPTVAAEEFAALADPLRQVALTAVCLDPRTRDLLDHGATFVYRYEAAAGPVADLPVVNGDCP